MNNEMREFKKKQYLRKLSRNINIIKKDYNDITEEILRDVMSDSGEAVINVNITDKSELYHSFSNGTQINPDVYDYIDSMVYPISAAVPIKIMLNVNGVTDTEQAYIKRIMQNHYVLELCDKQQDYEHNMLKGAVLSAVGFLLMIGYVLLDRSSAGTLVMEIASIAAIFALWEAVDCFFLESRVLSINRLNAGQLATAEIGFTE